LITDGVITAVGGDVAVPHGVEVMDASGRWVLPGFIDARAHVGVAEEAGCLATNCATERASRASVTGSPDS
jgi:imidazolonepropionase-like amidohydrolase